MKLRGLAPLLILVLLVASCGGDDNDDKSEDGTTTTGALFVARDVVPEVERDIVRRAKKEDRGAGNDPADYTYEVKCVPESDVKLNCRLDLVDKSGENVNTVAYAADVDPDSGEFGYTVTSNRDTRKQRGS